MKSRIQPDSTQLAVRSSIGIWFYDVHTLAPKLNLFTGHTDPVNAMAYSPDGKTLASGSSDKTIRLWDTVTGDHRQTLEGPYGGSQVHSIHSGWSHSCQWELVGRNSFVGCPHRRTQANP